MEKVYKELGCDKDKISSSMGTSNIQLCSEIWLLMHGWVGLSLVHKTSHTPDKPFHAAQRLLSAAASNACEREGCTHEP